MSIVVTTPTGHVGSRVVRLLLQAGVRPTVLLRDPSRLDAETRRAVDVRQGDLADAGYVREATEGADALFWVDPPDYTSDDPVATSARLGANVADAVRRNEISRVVFQSSVGAEKRHGAGLIDGLARVEEQLDDTGASRLFLRCGYFFTNLLDDVDSLREGVLTTAMPADAPMPWVDPRDVGDVAAARLLSDGWSGREVQAVHGPEDLTYAQVAETVTAATGQHVRLTVVSDDDVRESLRGAGMPARSVEGIVAMSSGLREDFTPEQPRTLVTTTPTTLAGWAYAHLRPLMNPDG